MERQDQRSSNLDVPQFVKFIWEMKPRPASYSNEATRDMSQFLGIANKMGICQIFFLIVDIACNFIVDGFSSDPMIGFILFM